MTNEEIYENVMGHKPNKEFGIKGSFSWDDIDALMNEVKKLSISDVRSSKSSSKSGLKGNDITPYSEWAKKLRDL